MNSGVKGVPARVARRRFTVIQASPLLAALVLSAGCGGGGGGSSATVTTPVTPPVVTPPVVTPPAVTSVSAPALGSFTATLSEDVASVGVGGVVNYTTTLTNSSGAAATVTANTINSASVPNASLFVSNSAGRTVYPPASHPGVRPQADPPPPPPINNGVVTLQPGQSISQTRPVAVFSQADTYQAVATFTVAAGSTDAAQTVTLSALPVTVK